MCKKLKFGQKIPNRLGKNARKSQGGDFFDSHCIRCTTCMTLIDVYDAFWHILGCSLLFVVLFFRQIYDVIECYTNWFVHGLFFGPPFFVLHFPVLHFPALQICPPFSGPAFSGPANSSPAVFSPVHLFCIFRSTYFIPLFPLLFFIFQSCIFSRAIWDYKLYAVWLKVLLHLIATLNHCVTYLFWPVAAKTLEN